MNEAAYVSSASSLGVWKPRTLYIHDEFGNGAKAYSKIFTRNSIYETKSMTDILGQLKFEFHRKRRKGNGLVLLYKGQ